MAYQKTRFKIKTSTVNSTPQPTDLIPGELAFSEISGGLFIKYSNGTVQQINNGTGYYQTRWDLISGLIADNPTLSSALNAKQDLLVPASGITLVGGAIGLNYAAIISNLNMGTAAFKDVGTGSNDVAAGNHTHTKFEVGLGNVDNTSDLSKPISSATQAALNTKADKTLASPITDGLMSKEDKSKLDGLDGSIGGADLSFVLDRANHTGTQAISTVSGLQTALDGKVNSSAVSSYSLGVLGSANQSAFKTAIGIGNVDNTSDLSKPISSATQAALNAKQNVLTAGSNISIVGDTISVTGLSLTADWSSITNKPTTFAPSAHTHTKSEVGLANVDNTSDANKPISVATQAALDGKASNAVATTSVNGLMSSADKTKLNGIATNATANSTDAFLLSRTNHTGTQAISTVSGLQTALDGKVNSVAFSSYFLTLTTSADSNALKSLLGLDQVTNTNDLAKPVSTATQTALNAKADKTAATTTADGLMSSADKTKLNGIAFSATANSSDAFLLSRTNHTGTQAISTVSGLQTALDGKADKTNATGLQAGLMAPADKIKLDGVDTNATANSPDATLLDRANHTGTQAISTVSGLQTALDGKQATLTAGANVTIVGNTISATIDGTIETDWSSITNKPTTFAPSAHTHTKSEVGLANVDNTSDVAKPVSIATQAALDLKVNLSSVSSYVLNNILGSASAASIKTTLALNNVDNTSDLAKPISTATQTALNGKADTTVATTSVNGLMSSADKTKLNGIATNATANSPDATLLSRANHTGTQAISTVTGLQTALDGKQATLTAGSNITIVGNTISAAAGGSIQKASTATSTQVSASSSSVTLLASNVNRLGFSFANESNMAVYIAYANTASNTAYSIKLDPGDYYETSAYVYRGQISAIWDSSSTPTGFVAITELTA